MTLRDYSTRQICMEALAFLRRWFEALEPHVKPAQWVPWDGRYNWRFTEQELPQLLMQKFARQISGVEATDLLLRGGRLQEVGVLYRMLDEIDEDILFLVSAYVHDDWTENHSKYCEYFWSESDSNGPSVRRQAIRAYVNRAFGQPDPSSADKTGKSIFSAYSDFVHARSHPIMGMIVGPPPRFALDPIFDDRARKPYSDQQPTYFYRCMMSATAVAKVVAPDQISFEIYKEQKAFSERQAHYLFPRRVAPSN